MYTDKDQLKVMIFTDHFRIEGSIHILVGSRLTDALNSKTKDFFAITDARIYKLDEDQVMFETAYMAVNREAIACMFPV